MRKQTLILVLCILFSHQTLPFSVGECFSNSAEPCADNVQDNWTLDTLSLQENARLGLMGDGEAAYKVWAHYFGNKKRALADAWALIAAENGNNEAIFMMMENAYSHVDGRQRYGGFCRSVFWAKKATFDEEKFKKLFLERMEKKCQEVRGEDVLKLQDVHPDAPVRANQ